jgi:hypothetical protein
MQNNLRACTARAAPSDFATKVQFQTVTTKKISHQRNAQKYDSIDDGGHSESAETTAELEDKTRSNTKLSTAELEDKTPSAPRAYGNKKLR